MAEPGGKRRIDRILRPEFVGDLEELALDEVRERRDECLAEREYLSLLRRLVQGRSDILRAEATRRREGVAADESLVENLSSILSGSEGGGPSRGEAVRVALPDEEMLRARRRVERLISDAALSDPGALSDEKLEGAIETLAREEREISDARASVIAVHDRLQDELKRRYKEDPSRALRP